MGSRVDGNVTHLRCQERAEEGCRVALRVVLFVPQGKERLRTLMSQLGGKTCHVPGAVGGKGGDLSDFKTTVVLRGSKTEVWQRPR